MILYSIIETAKAKYLNVLHGFQLRHTHRDGPPTVQHQNCRYIFPESSYGANLTTSNIMSYNTNFNAYTSWRWQWEIIQTNV